MVKVNFENSSIEEKVINTYCDRVATIHNELHEKVKYRLSSSSKYVPFTVIGEKYWIGWNENNKDKIIEAIENYDYSRVSIGESAIESIDTNADSSSITSLTASGIKIRVRGENLETMEEIFAASTGSSLIDKNLENVLPIKELGGKQ